MSLVNDMLRNLQQRSRVSPAPLAGLKPIERQARRFETLVFVAVVAAGTAFGLERWFEHAAHLPSTTDATVSAAAELDSDAVWGSPHGTPFRGVSEPVSEMALRSDVNPILESTVASRPTSEGKVIPVVKTLPSLTNHRQAEQAFGLAIRLRSTGKTKDAAGEFELALSLAPNYHEAREGLAAALVELGQYDTASAVLDEGLLLAPSHLPYVMLRARLLVETGAVGAAITLLEAAPPEVFDPEYGAFLAALLQRVGEHERAIELYAQVLRDDPGRAHWWMGLGISLEARGKSGEALEVYRAARAAGTLEREPRSFVDRRILALLGERP